MKLLSLTFIISLLLSVVNIPLEVEAKIPAESVKPKISYQKSSDTNNSNGAVSSKQLIEDLLKEASTHIGKRYRAGAKGPNQFDCSGFSSYVFRQFGISLNPSSSTQYQQGEEISRNELRKGDLVFFTRGSKGKTVGHVGIVTNVDNDKGTFKFIHASNTGITVSEYEGYYKNTYVGARRIIF